MTIDELEELEKAATPGPWLAKSLGEDRCDGITAAHNHAIDVDCYDVEDADERPCPALRNIVSTDSGYYGPKWTDAALIVAARNILPKLLRMARAVANHDMQDSADPISYCSWCLCDWGHSDDCDWVMAQNLVYPGPL